MESYFDLGSHARLITTASEDAQVWFNRGLNWLYGFNHPESVACFQRAAVCDPACAMAHWGIALAKGPYIKRLSGNKAFITEQFRSYAGQGLERTYWISGCLPCF